MCPLRCWAVYWRRRCLSSASSASRNIPSNRNIRFPQILYFFKNKNCISPNSCLRYFPISYRAVNGCCTAGRMVIGNTPLDIWQILVIKFLYSIPELTTSYGYISVLYIFLGAIGKWVAENYVSERLAKLV